MGTIYRDIHLNGPEFGVPTASGPVSSFSNLAPGAIDTNYHYDTQASFTYLASRGYKRVKLPFRWERLQPTLNGALDAAELSRLTSCLNRINTAGMKAIVDCHNYGLYYKDATPTAQPVLVASGSGSTLLAGTYTIGYSHWNGSDSSMGPTQDITITAGQNIVMTANGVPSTMTSVNFWLTAAPATTNLGYLSGAGISSGSASYTLTSKTQGSGGSAPATGFGIGRRTTLGDADLPISSFSDLWTRLTTALYKHPAILGGGAYCVMAEPQNSGGLTLATWQTASQAAVTAIRAIDAVVTLHICGFTWANCRNWSSINGAPWITDSGGNLRYEAHSYFDDQVSGQYPATYAAEITNATTAGFTAGNNVDAETSRIRADLKGFHDWLLLYGQQGIIGEVGWPNTPSGEQAQWNALGNVFLTDADLYNIDTVAWQCGEWSIDKLTIYTGIPLSSGNAQSATVEAHPTYSTLTPSGITYSGGPVQYRYLFYDLVTNAALGELELSGVRYSRLLNAAGSFSATLALGDSRVLNKNPIAITEPRRTRLYIEREASLVWGGIVWTRRYDDRARTLQLAGQEFWSYFQSRGSDTGRFIVNSLTWTQKDQLLIAGDLVAYAQGKSLAAVDGGPLSFPKPGGDLGVQTFTAPSGVLRDRTYDATTYQEVGRALEELAAVDNGFDFSIDVAYVGGVPTASLVLSYPRRGVTVAGGGPVFEKPGNLLGYAWPEDGTQFADTAYALGDGEGAAMLRSSASRTDLIDAGYPLIEQRRSYKGSGINQQSTLDAHARADVNAAASASAFPVLRVRGSGAVPVGSYTTGDDCRLRISDERFPNPDSIPFGGGPFGGGSYGGYGGADQHLDAYYRIIGYEVLAPSGSQDEEVTLTLGAAS